MTPLEQNCDGIGTWEFDKEVADNFEQMLSRSIPQYGMMRELTFLVGQHYVDRTPLPELGFIVDLGCSSGLSLDRFVRHYGAHARYCGIEVSEPMIHAAKQKFANFIESGIVEILPHDLTTRFPRRFFGVDLCLSVLTLQFVPVEHRPALVGEVYRMLKPGGGLVLVEKTIAEGHEEERTLSELYHDHKKQNGYSEDEISRKALALRGRLVPLTETWNRSLLKAAGFRNVYPFWRYLNFIGIAATK